MGNKSGPAHSQYAGDYSGVTSSVSEVAGLTVLKRRPVELAAGGVRRGAGPQIYYGPAEPSPTSEGVFQTLEPGMRAMAVAQGCEPGLRPKVLSSASRYIVDLGLGPPKGSKGGKNGKKGVPRGVVRMADQESAGSLYALKVGPSDEPAALDDSDGLLRGATNVQKITIRNERRRRAGSIQDPSADSPRQGRSPGEVANLHGDAERNGGTSPVDANNQERDQVQANTGIAKASPEASAPVLPSNHFSLKNELHLRRNLLKQNLNQKRPLESKATGASASCESSPLRHVRVLEGWSPQPSQKATIREVEIT